MPRRTLYALAIVGAFAAVSLTRRHLFRPTEHHPGPATLATGDANPADADLGVPGDNLEARLDEALEESFPASDPVAIHIE